MTGTPFSAVPFSVMLSAADARRLQWAIGAARAANVGARSVTLTLTAVLADNQGAAGVILMDIADAQELLAMHGYLSRIDLVLDAADTATLTRLRAMLPPDARLTDQRRDLEGMTEMTRAFRINLVALSLLALLVGGVLIYNAMMFSVVQRYPLFGMLRALGATREQVLRMVLMEALALGVMAVVGGLLLGTLLGEGLLHLVVRTINDLYLPLSESRLRIGMWPLCKAVTLGVGLTLVAALVPAWDAMSVTPGTMLVTHTWQLRLRRALPIMFAAGVLIMALGVIWLMQPTAGLAAGFASLFLVVVGFGLVVPLLVLGVVQVLAWRCRWCGGLSLMALRNNARHLRRTGMATLTLSVAVATVTGVGLMVHSFRHSLEDWLDYRLQADLYISLHDNTGGLTIDPALIAALQALPGIREVRPGLRTELATNVGPAETFVVSVQSASLDAYKLLDGDADSALPALRAGQGVLVSEPFANHHHLRVGDALIIDTPLGSRAHRVMGIFRDYGSERGRLLLDRGYYSRVWGPARTSNLALTLSAPAMLSEVQAQAQTLVQPWGLQVLASRDIRARSLDIFDRTFTVTEVVRMLAVLVTAIGILAAFMALRLERRREMAVLRAMGMTPGQLWRLTLWETGILGSIGGLLALPLGIGLAYGLVYIINIKSFGWSMDLLTPPSYLLQSWLLALGAALLAGIYPAWKTAGQAPARALLIE